jgi:GH25 family lysozyme M1 (1,4-beta-N-acetylmuramidase)
MGATGATGTSGALGPVTAPLGPVPAPVVAQPIGSLPGIDISHHQDTIDWAQVAASGVRFAVAKATEGQTFVDPQYAINRAGAEAAGVAFTAYHFARPDETPNDAVLEADHFVDTALLAPGNLIPALDIERTGGLSQAEVTTWILTWLDRVNERLGVRPMVYTSPNGWDARTGDTTAVADAGYTVLWVAHWGVSEPRLPGNEWSGNGWTFWQYSNCGSVPGIVGCVDLDWYGSTTFEPVTIGSPDAVAPTATFDLSASAQGDVVVSFDEIVRQVTPDNVFVWAPTSGTYPQIAQTCVSGKGVVVDCLTGNVRNVQIRIADPLVLGESYEAVVNPAIVPMAVVDRAGNLAASSTLPFAAPGTVEERDATVSYGWRIANDDRAFGGSYAVERAAGATASFTFQGPAVTWYTATGPAQGRAAVRIDDRFVGTFDQHAGSAAFRVARTFQHLGAGEHTITIRVLGRGAPGADTRVVVDGFAVGRDRSSEAAMHASWARFAERGASAGGVTASGLVGASAELRFRGSGIRWTTMRDVDHGRAAIYVDGELVREVDGYAPEPTFGVVRSVLGLADGVHTLRIEVLGASRGRATGTLVSIDGFAVVP